MQVCRAASHVFAIFLFRGVKEGQLTRAGTPAKSFNFNFLEAYGVEILEAGLYFLDNAKKPELSARAVLTNLKFTIMSVENEELEVVDLTYVDDVSYPEEVFDIGEMKVFMGKAVYGTGKQYTSATSFIIRKYKTQPKKDEKPYFEINIPAYYLTRFLLSVRGVLILRGLPEPKTDYSQAKTEIVRQIMEPLDPAEVRLPPKKVRKMSKTTAASDSSGGKATAPIVDLA